MQTRCPHCGATVVVELGQAVRTDGGTRGTRSAVDGLRGERRHCAECGQQFSVYVY